MPGEWVDVSDITPRISYTATASQTVFVVPFVFFENSDLKVYRNTTLLTLGTHYSVTGAEEEDGGAVTLGVGCTVGDQVMIVREVPIEQTTHIPPSGPFDIPALNIQLSKFVAMIQQLFNGVSRSLRLADNVPGTLEVAAPVAGEYLKWNAAADGVESAAVVTPDGSYAVATQSEAEAGSLNTVLMTPLRTAQQVVVTTATRFPLTRADLKALNTTEAQAAYLREVGREGQFLWRTGDYSAAIAGDPTESGYLKADAVATTVGAWVKIGSDSSVDIDIPNSIFKFGNNTYPDRQPHPEINVIHTAQGTVVVGGDNLTGTDVSATVSTIIGYRAGEATATNALLYGCDFMGFRTGGLLTDAQYFTAIGIDAAHSATFGRVSFVGGAHAANWKTDIQGSTILMGAYAEGSVLDSVIIGSGACDNNQVAGTSKAITDSVIIGNIAGRQMNVTGTAGSVIIGYAACSVGNLSGGNNVVVGRGAGSNMTLAEKCTFVGDGAGGLATSPNQSSFGFGAACTGNDQVTLGNSSVATLRCQVTSITALSDERDKYDVEPIPLGLDFILALGEADAVVRHKWDMRDGSRKTDEFEPGVIAQRLAAVEDLFEARWMGLVDRRNPDRIEATPGKLLFPLIKAVQELTAIVKAQSEEIAALKMR